jgi:hypothetical protein
VHMLMPDSVPSSKGERGSAGLSKRRVLAKRGTGLTDQLAIGFAIQYNDKWAASLLDCTQRGGGLA